MLTNFALAFLKDRHLLETFSARMEDEVFVLMFVFACQPWLYGHLKPHVEAFRLLGRVFPGTPSGTVANKSERTMGIFLQGVAVIDNVLVALGEV